MKDNTAPIPAIKITEQKAWRGTYRDIAFKIVQWNFESPLPDFECNWNYYIYLNETRCANFAALWLQDEVKQFSDAGRKYISHDYMTGIVGSIDMHGGITYYAKHGHTEGFRSVEIGCDFQHLWDQHQSYSLEYVKGEVLGTIESIYSLGIVSPAA